MNSQFGYQEHWEDWSWRAGRAERAGAAQRALIEHFIRISPNNMDI